ncbi:dihydrofolate reductase family protein [Fibrobacterota bacterium]
MLPKVILHNSITLNGAYINIEVNMGLHYQVAGQYGADAHLIGSATVKTGIEAEGGLAPEEEKDFARPEKNSSLPYFVIVDSLGALKGMLHVFRRFEFCRDVIALVSDTTPEDYLDYLRQRKYEYITAGQDRVDLKKALEALNEKYQVKIVVVDTGKVLANLLLDQGLVNELSLLITPVVSGGKPEGLFDDIAKDLKLKLIKCEGLDGCHVRMLYRVG